MRIAFLLLLPLAIVSLAPAQQPVAHPDKLAGIKPAMQKFIDSGDISGAVAVVGRKDGIVYHGAVGLCDIASKSAMEKDTLFRIASMTKPITAMGIMILVDEGKLKPDDDVAKYLPEFTGQMLHEPRLKDTPGDTVVILKKPARPIKIRDLLTHTSGVAP